MSFISSSQIKSDLCNYFCTNMKAIELDNSIKVITPFLDEFGDKVIFFVNSLDSGEIILEDDGEFLSHLKAAKISFTDGVRKKIFTKALELSNSSWDEQTYEVRTILSDKNLISERAILFIQTLLKLRQLNSLSREQIETTFFEDCKAKFIELAGSRAVVNDNQIVDDNFTEFVPDLVIKPQSNISNKKLAVFLATSDNNLSDAMLMSQDAQLRGRHDISVVAMLKDENQKAISSKRLKMANNRIGVHYFYGDEDAAVTKALSNIGIDRIAI